MAIKVLTLTFVVALVMVLDLLYHLSTDPGIPTIVDGYSSGGHVLVQRLLGHQLVAGDFISLVVILVTAVLLFTGPVVRKLKRLMK